MNELDLAYRDIAAATHLFPVALSNIYWVLDEGSLSDEQIDQLRSAANTLLAATCFLYKGSDREVKEYLLAIGKEVYDADSGDSSMTDCLHDLFDYLEKN